MTDDDRVRSVARQAGRLLGALGLASLAGCSAVDGDGRGDATPTQPGDTDSDADGDQTMGDQATDDQDGTATGDGHGTATADGPTECTDARRQELDRRIEELEAELAETPAVHDPYEGYGRRAYARMVEQLEEGFPAETLRAAERVGTEARESVLVLEVYEGGQQVGGGTGWYVDETHVFTNAHVVYEGTIADAVKGFTVDGDEVELEVVDLVEELQPDLALLSADRPGTPLPTASGVDLAEGQPLVQVGHPSDVGFWVHTLGKFVTGIELLTDVPYTSLNTTVQGREGVSGSPLLDLDGNVVGITEGVSHPGAREFGDEATPAPEILYDVPLAVIAVSSHVGVDGIARYYDRWT